MFRFVAAFAVVVSLCLAAVGCGAHEPPEVDPAALEAHRLQMEAISARERGG